MPPDGLPHLTLVGRFHPELGEPYGLQHLAFGDSFDQGLSNVVLPNCQQPLTLVGRLTQRLEDVTLPRGRPHLTFGDGFCQGLEYVMLPDGLQHLMMNSTRAC